jgi:hypothetical protein
MKLIKEWRLNLKTVSEANNTQHWTKVSARKKIQKRVIFIKWLSDTPRVCLPCKVKLTRIGGKFLDIGDNLPMAFKAIRDALADRLIPDRPPGWADSSPLIQWEYDQVKGAPSGIIVQFFSDQEAPTRSFSSL